MAAIAFLVLALAPVALAASKTVFNTLGGSSGTTGGFFNTPRGVAVNQTGAGGVPAGTFYVVDSGNRRIQRFGPAGEFVSTWGWGVKDGEGEFEICKVAADCRAGIGGTGAGQLGDGGAQGIAIDQTNGFVYVSDQATGNRRIDIYSATGGFGGAFGWGVRTTSANEFQFCTTLTGCKAANTSSGAQGGKFGTGIGGLAVDASGNIYVANKTNRRVDIFKPTVSGAVLTGVEFLRAFGWDVATGGGTSFEVCTVAANCKQGTSGTGVGQFASSNSPSDVSVDAKGNIYALDLGNKRVQEFSSAPAPLTATFGSAALSAAFGTGELQNIAVDPSAAPNHLLVSGKRSGSANNVAVQELDQTGGAVDLHGAELTPTAATGLAVAQTTIGANIYLASGSGGHRVFVLNETPTMKPVTIFTGATALFEGDVVSNGISTNYHFEYSPDAVNWIRVPTSDAAAGSSSASASIAATGSSTGTLTVKARGGTFTLTFQGQTTVPLAHNSPPATIEGALNALTTIGAAGGSVTVSGGPGDPSGSAPYGLTFGGTLIGHEVTEIGANPGWLLAPLIPVSQGVTGLTGSQLYHVRLIQDRPAGGGSAASLETTFTTEPAAPAISATGATQITSTEVVLNGRINTQNTATTYHFEYGTADCSVSACASTPTTDTSAGEGGSEVVVSRGVSELVPATTYHYRLVATNASGTTESLDRTFNTYPPPAPNGRGYEMVSPPEKHGVDISHNQSIQSAVSGDAAVFSSLGGFADSPSASILSYYRSSRANGTWTTRGISPPVAPQGSEIVYASMMALSDDLSRSVMQMFPAPPTVVGSQPTAPDFYRHEIPDGPFENLTPIVPDPDNFESTGFSAGTNDAMSVVGINSSQQLTPDAPAGAQFNAYVWSGGELHYVGIFPDGTMANAFVGSYVGAQCCLESKNAISSDGSQVVFSAKQAGDEMSVYIRTNLTSTVEASASQRTPPDPGGPQPATFQGASVAGDKVFFYSTEQLVNSDADSSNDLYVYEPQSGELRRLSVDENPDDGVGAGVEQILASSDDGTYVYFAASGLLLPGEPEVDGMKLYVWHDDGSAGGTLAYVATLDATLDALDWHPQLNNKRPRVQASPDGRYFVFTARTRVGDYDNAGHAELYVYATASGEVKCVSCDPSGSDATGDAGLYGMNASPVRGIDVISYAPRNVTDNGFVFFESEDALTPSDSNGTIDVYEWQAGEVSPISSGVSETDAHFGDASRDGRDVFFLTRDRLVGVDVDNNFDLYDARVGGGVASQNPVRVPDCIGESCRGQAEPTPPLANLGSNSVEGPENATPIRAKRQPCSKGRRRVKRNGRSRCVRKRRGKGRAGRDGRAGR